VGDPCNQSGEQFAGGGKKQADGEGEEAEGDENPVSGTAKRLTMGPERVMRWKSRAMSGSMPICKTNERTKSSQTRRHEARPETARF